MAMSGCLMHCYIHACRAIRCCLNASPQSKVKGGLIVRNEAIPSFSSFAPSGKDPQSVLHPERLLDMRDPASWYPLARQQRRRIIAHLGPTNSGEHWYPQSNIYHIYYTCLYSTPQFNVLQSPDQIISFLLFALC